MLAMPAYGTGRAAGKRAETGHHSFADRVAPRPPWPYKRAVETARPVRAAVAVFPRSSPKRTNRPSSGIAPTESKMPKLKTKSGAKKRFKITGTGKVVYAQRGKRHGMIKRTKKQIRQLRGTRVLFKTDGDNIKKYFLPND